MASRGIPLEVVERVAKQLQDARTEAACKRRSEEEDALRARFLTRRTNCERYAWLFKTPAWDCDTDYNPDQEFKMWDESQSRPGPAVLFGETYIFDMRVPSLPTTDDLSAAPLAFFPRDLSAIHFFGPSEPLRQRAVEVQSVMDAASNERGDCEFICPRNPFCMKSRAEILCNANVSSPLMRSKCARALIAAGQALTVMPTIERSPTQHMFHDLALLLMRRCNTDPTTLSLRLRSPVRTVDKTTKAMLVAALMAVIPRFRIIVLSHCPKCAIAFDVRVEYCLASLGVQSEEYRPYNGRRRRSITGRSEVQYMTTEEARCYLRLQYSDYIFTCCMFIYDV